MNKAPSVPMTPGALYFEPVREFGGVGVYCGRSP
jgi:hypothetical protein